MTGIILGGQALKVVNKGGGRKCRTQNIGGGQRVIYTGPKEMGTDYIVFNCPGCDSRNKQSVYQCKGRAGNSLSFKCNRCRREIEVSPPRHVPLVLGLDGSARNRGR